MKFKRFGFSLNQLLLISYYFINFLNRIEFSISTEIGRLAQSHNQSVTSAPYELDAAGLLGRTTYVGLAWASWAYEY